MPVLETIIAFGLVRHSATRQCFPSKLADGSVRKVLVQELPELLFPSNRENPSLVGRFTLGNSCLVEVVPIGSGFITSRLTLFTAELAVNHATQRQAEVRLMATDPIANGSEDSRLTSRRTISGLLVASGSLLAGGVLGIPTLIFALSPVFKRRRETWRSLGPLQDFRTGKVSQGVISIDRAAWPRSFGQQAVFVWRRSKEDIIVFSRSCTDLGCPLDYEPGSGCFLCPCHGGIFAQDGQPLAGPTQSPMHRYSHRVRAEVLEIDIASIPPAA